MMKAIAYWALIFGIIFSSSLSGQREVAVVDFEVIADSLMADYHIPQFIDSMDAHFFAIGQRMVESFQVEVTKAQKLATGGCLTPEGLAKLEAKLTKMHTKLQSFLNKYDELESAMESAIEVYMDNFVEILATQYSGLEGSHALVSSKPVIYKNELVPDLTLWVLAYSRKNFRSVTTTRPSQFLMSYLFVNGLIPR